MRVKLVASGQVFLVEVDLLVLENDFGEMFMAAGQVSPGSVAFGHVEDPDFPEVVETLGLDGVVLSAQRLKLTSDGKLEPMPK